MNKNESYINNINLKKKENSTGKDFIILSLNFSINGLIREVLNQKTWEKAYDKHDNSLRLTIKLDIKSNGKIIDSIKLIRKAIFFWTRNPKISHRIWIMIVKDDNPYYPLQEEEAKALLLDFNKDIEIPSSKLKKGNNDVSIEVNLSWERHTFIEKNQITKESNTENIQIHG